MIKGLINIYKLLLVYGFRVAKLEEEPTHYRLVLNLDVQLAYIPAQAGLPGHLPKG